MSLAEQGETLRQWILRDPADAAEWIFGVKLWREQRRILRSIFRNRRTTAKTCHKIGKSMVLAIAVALWMLAYPGKCKVVTTAPTQRQVREILWQEIRALWDRALFRGMMLGPKPSVEKWELGPNWVAIGVSSKDYDESSFQGFNSPHGLVLMDEAAGISESVFTGAKGITSNAGSHLALTGNPTNPLGSFAKSFTSRLYEKISVSAFETPNFLTHNVTRSDVEQDKLRERWGDSPPEMPYPFLIAPDYAEETFENGGYSPTDAIYMGRVLAEFPQSSPDTLIHLHWLERAFDNWDPKTRKGVVQAGGDIARFGSDESAMALAQGGQAWLAAHGRGWDTTQTSGRFADVLRQAKAAVANIDADGLGAGVADNLRAQNLSTEIVDFHGGGSPADKDRFLNLRAEGYWTVRTMMEAGELAIDPAWTSLASQITNIKFKYNSRGKRQIESKEDAKKRGLKSPDHADALMMALVNVPREAPALVWF